jgi:tetratricopeptide (TPR) repeat protein
MSPILYRLALLMVAALLLAACPRPTPTPGSTPAPPATDTPAPTATPAPTETPTPPVTGAEADPADLEALVAASLGITTSETATYTIGIEGVRAIALENPLDDRPLWLAYTYGLRNFDPLQNHLLAIYTYDGDEWLELAQVELADNGDPENPAVAPDYVGDGSVTQVAIEPTHIWVQLEGGVGAHSGVYGLYSFDGSTLALQVPGFSSSPGVGRLADLNNDGIQEVLLDATDYYVFCYACGVRKIDYTVWRWDGTQMAPVTLEPLPADAPAELQTINERALALVAAGLWKDALAAVEEAQTLSVSDPSETFTWNSALIRLNAEAKRDAISDSPYPLLANLFYGDFDAAVAVIRDEAWVDGAFSPDSPLITGTVAEGWEEALADWITNTVDPALAYNPDLAAAYFLRGWATYVRTGDEAAALPDVQRAAELAPDDEFYAKSVEFLAG